MILFIVLFVGITIYGEDLELLIGAEQAEILLNGDSINELQTKNPNSSLVPNISGVQELVQSVQSSFDPNIMVESLYLYKKPAEANPNAWTADERTALFNHSLALSSLAGVEYYSTSRKKMRTFYEISEIIDNPESKIPQQDPQFSVLPEDLMLYARQEDLTFGDNIYQYVFHIEENYLVFVQENLTDIRAGIIPVAGKNQLRSVVAVIDSGEYFLIYLVSMADTILLPGLSKRMGESFSTRAEAVLHWFTGQADKAFASVSVK